MTAPAADGPRVGIVGGGLAGLAAAVALSTTDCRVQLFEARRRPGGRATSYRDPVSGELVDFCQHVSMRCCTNLADLVRRTGIAAAFAPARVLHFIAPSGEQCDFAASRWLPAPLHLALAFRRLKYLTAADRRGIARALWAMLRRPFTDGPEAQAVAQWLQDQGQSAAAVEYFWAPVLVSALGESLAQAAMGPARKVFVDGFMASREAYIVEVPQVPLGELYGERVPQWLAEQGVAVQTSAAIKQVDRTLDRRLTLTLAAGDVLEFDRVIVAVPWQHLEGILSPTLRSAAPEMHQSSKLAAAPITGIHLWFDRPITSLPHAVLVGRLGQWLFNRGSARPASGADVSSAEFYYQVVISASHDLSGRSREDVTAEVCAELRAIWPAAAAAALLRSRVVTENAAVFSVRPGSDASRLPQRTSIEGLFLAGDWTDTGWPATMEGAVRSGYLAAEAVTASLGRGARFVVPDLPRSWLMRLLCR
jgi:squalene-associated FAD-dependent desaturase